MFISLGMAEMFQHFLFLDKTPRHEEDSQRKFLIRCDIQLGGKTGSKYC